uniref:Uncharacterized protein n=1 Tax=Anopheles coluzzii TaxID=1518534 RepID=A0A8W7PPK7_ANOCL
MVTKELSAPELVDLVPLATEPGNDLISFVQERDEHKVAQDQKDEELVEDQSKIEKALEDAMSDIVEQGESEDISGRPIGENNKPRDLEDVPEEANSVDEDHVEQETTHDVAHDGAHDEAIEEISKDVGEDEDRRAGVEVGGQEAGVADDGFAKVMFLATLDLVPISRRAGDELTWSEIATEGWSTAVAKQDSQ